MFFLMVLSFLVGYRLSGQNTEKQPLTIVLKLLSERYNVSFSYVDESIANVMAITPNETLSLADALYDLEIDTNLRFNMINERFISITKPLDKERFIVTEQLDEVLVTNYLTSGITKLNDGSLNIKPSNFGILPGLIEPDVLQTIQALPGVFSVEESVSNLNIRGGTHDQNLILWDGIKMYQSGHFFGLISAFNPYTTSTVNVSKNGTRARYGDGVSGVIDMQLDNDVEGHVKLGAGLNLINAHAHAKIPLAHNMELQVSARRSITDIAPTPTYDQYFKRTFQDSDFENNAKTNNTISQNEDFYFYDINTKLLYDVTKKDRLRLNMMLINNAVIYQERANINNEDIALNSNLSQKNHAYGVTYTRNWGKNVTTNAQFYIADYSLNATNADVINNQSLVQKNEVFDGTARFDVDYSLNHIKLNFGYQFSEVGVGNLEKVNNPNFRSFVKDVVRSHSVYAESAYLSRNARTRLNIGFRANVFKNLNETLIEPRLNFSQRFLNAFRFEVLGELKSQTTSQIIDLQNDFLGIEKRRWVIANNRTEVSTINGKSLYPVPIVKSQQISAGIHYNKNKLLISAEAFLKHVNGITTRNQGFQNQYQFVYATGHYDVKGIDFLVNKQFNNSVSTWFGYSLSKNDYTFPSLNNGNAFPNNADIRHALTVASTFNYKNLKFAGGLNWYSGRPITEPAVPQNDNDDVINYDTPNTSNLEDYVRADLSANYSFNLKGNTKGIFGVSVWNILNKKNVLNRYYTEDNSNSIVPTEIQSLGITPNISLRFTF